MNQQIKFFRRKQPKYYYHIHFLSLFYRALTIIKDIIR